MLDYREFAAKLQEYGALYLTLSDTVPPFGMYVDGRQWFTGDSETDPWGFRARVPREGIGLYGCHLGGKKGYVARDLIAPFLAACSPEGGIESLYRRGELDALTYRMYDVFRRRRVLSTIQLREELRYLGKPSSAMDRAAERLQGLGEITIVDHVRRINKKGEPYGWEVSLFQVTDDRLEALGIPACVMDRADAQSFCAERFAAAWGDDAAERMIRALGWNI